MSGSRLVVGEMEFDRRPNDHNREGGRRTAEARLT